MISGRAQRQEDAAFGKARIDRHQLLRRDNHACRYCGRSAPEVPLTVDAVVPEALGGSHKDPANLVAACADRPDMGAGMHAPVTDAGARGHHMAGMAAGSDAMLVHTSACADVTNMRSGANAMFADIEARLAKFPEVGEFNQKL